MEELAKHCSKLRNILHQDKASLEIRTGENASKSLELEEMASKLAEIQESVSVFERTVTEAGLPADKQLAAIVPRKIIEEKAALQSSQQTLTNLESNFSSTNKRIKELNQKQDQHKESRERANVEVLHLEQQIAALHAKAEALGLSLEMTSEELAVENKAVASHKERAAERISKLTPQIETLTQTVNKMDLQINELVLKNEKLRQEKMRLEEELRLYEESAVALIDRNVITLDAITEQRSLAEERVNQLDALKRRCITLERSVDAAQRSALFAELEAKAQSLAKERQTLEKDIERMSEVKKLFASVKDALDRQSASAVAKHVAAFGPLTTLIQKRLRAVYGFGDVSLLAKGNNIRVEIGWESIHVKPTDYFSDSQKQILMLSLFLANRLTQTWSGFAPIFMDDPVTHFDDLNAFGFVELIRNLVSTSPGNRQFFISTCDDRLFELMMKKFNGVKGRAKFFRFEGIGHDGPIVRENRQ